MPPSELRASLKRLASSTEPPTLRRLWRALDIQVRAQALRAVLDDEDAPRGDYRGILVQIVADARNFRLQTVQRFPLDKLLQDAARLDLDLPVVIESAIRQLHMHHRRPLMAAFYASLGIAHDDGLVALDDLPAPAAQALETGRAADRLLAEHPADDVVTFALALTILYPEHFPALREWCAHVAGAGFQASPPAPLSLSRETQAPPGIQPVPTDVFGFTTLDRRLIVTIVNTATETIGALDADQLDDLLLEVIQLNSARHQSWFHIGFRDALLEQPLGEGIAAENEDRRVWYWAGAVSALARESRWADIGAAFDRPTGVREIGRTTTGADRAAAWIVFRALDEQGRVNEAREFLAPATVGRSDKLQQQLLATATRLIRESRAVDARPLLELLWIARDHAVKPHGEMSESFLKELRRRRALCFRQLGETEAARQLLEELAAEGDAVTRAVALTDLGLIAASVRRLGELVLPWQKNEADAIIIPLKRGKALFEEAAATPGFSPAHAQFCLGVIDFLEQRYDAAARRFEDALTVFQGSPEVYGRDRTLQLARLYLGLAICHAMNGGTDLARARDSIVAALREGVRIPRWLVADTVDALALARSDIAEDVANAILEHSPDSLDELISSEALTSTLGLTAALSRRAGNASRSTAARASDYRRVLPLHLARGDVSHAEDALAFLESAAAQQIGQAEFLELLERHDHYSPAWTEERAEEARIYLLECAGDWVNAAARLEQVSYRLLGSGDDHALDDVELILAHLDGFGPPGAEVAARLRIPLEARQAEGEEPGEAQRFQGVSLRLLVVGGNEVQARMDQDIASAVRAEFPGVSVDFLHTGWSSNWAHYCDEFDRRCRNADGIVFLSLMRTMLGRRLRQRCHLPWRGCGRKGQGAIVETVRRLIPFAATVQERRRLALEQGQVA